MRRELLDLARHYGARRRGMPQALPAAGEDSEAPGAEPADRDADPADLEKWCAFHQQVEQLPAEEREVVGLIFYHGWKQADVAQLFGVSERTVRRRWEAALVKLHQVLQSDQSGD
jgi:RNA polymerase sigma factor (sigma-70 family)